MRIVLLINNFMEHYLNLMLLLFYSLTQRVIIGETVPLDYLKEYKNGQYKDIRTNSISESKDLASCTCDLNQGLCDYHCCCDQDCKENVKNEWINDPMKVCKNSNNIKRMENFLCMNERETYNYNAIHSGLVYRDQISNLLCVTWDNSREMGEFYSAPPTDNLETKLDVIYENWKKSYIPTPREDPSTAYAYGKFIRISETATPLLYNNFYWYQSDPYGNCVRTYGVKFLIPNKKVSCNSATQISVSIFQEKRIQIGDIGTEILNSTLIYNRKIDGRLEAANDLTTCFIESLKLFFNTQRNQLISIHSAIICRELALRENVTMTFETQWLTPEDYVFKSGNPGYDYKKPVLLLTGGTTLYENGIFIRGSHLEGNCFTSAQREYYNPYDEPIRFGVDSMYSCDILAATDLTFFKDITSQLQTIGRFGSSNPDIENDWKATTDLFVFDLKADQDTTIIFQILTSKFGPKSKPQQYILGSKMLYFEESTAKQAQLRFITKFIPVSYDQFIKSGLKTSLPPFPSTITNKIPQ